MFRPICKASQKIAIKKEFVRTKVVRPASILKPAEKIKQYNRENKDLFGPLIETKKEKESREKKAAKNRSDQNNASKEATQKITNCVKSELNRPKHSVFSSLRFLKNEMWQNTRTCLNFAGVILNIGPVRCLKTNSVNTAARSWATEHGYASEDKILQIKQYQTDYMKQYPSVTLILNKTMTEDSKKALEKWKQERIAEIGEEEFNKFYQAQMGVGTKFHDTLKNYFTKPRSQLRIEKEVEGVWVSVRDVLKSISSPKAIESNVVHPVLKYRGIFDAIADYEDKPMLIEWKKSDKPRKTISMTYDNPVQVAAYFGAICNDLNYKHFNVRDALLVIAYTDGSKADVFHLTTDKLREHWAQWLIRHEEYMEKHGDNSQTRMEGGKRKFEEEIGNL